MKPADFLSHYATQFGTVEADTTYYRVPDEKLVRGWDERTPEGFVLSAKFPRSIVHAGEEARPSADVLLPTPETRTELARFLRVMGLLGPKCGPLVLQFPYFNKSVFAGSGPFLERLDTFLGLLPPDFRYGVEIRNKSWIDRPLLDLLKARNVALVWVDIPYMPHGADLAAKHDLFTADFAYLRLIGDRKAVEEATAGRFDRVVIDNSERLARWAPLVLESLGRVPETFAYANNHYAGHGPATIRELAALVNRVP